MVVKSELLTSFITLVKDQNITNALIQDNEIEKNINLDGIPYNLECIIQINDKNNSICEEMMHGGQPVSENLTQSFYLQIMAIFDNIYNSISGAGRSGRRTRAWGSEYFVEYTNELQNAINIRGDDVRVTIRQIRTGYMINIYRPSRPGRYNINIMHVSLFNPETPANLRHLSMNPTTRNRAGCTHPRLDEPNVHGNRGDFIPLTWSLNYDRNRVITRGPGSEFYYTCLPTNMEHAPNAALLNDPIIVDFIRTFNNYLENNTANEAAIDLIPGGTDMKRRLIAAYNERAAAAAAPGGPEGGPKGGPGAGAALAGGKSFRKKTKKTRRTKKSKKSKKTRKHRRR